MTFKKMCKPEYPPRLWALVGYPGSGKSTFATQMKSPMLIVDADHRFNEVLGLAGGDVYQLSDKPADNVNADSIAQHLANGMEGSDVQTIVVDSLTAIITPLIVKAMQDKATGRAKNLAAAFKDKAMAMRQLQDAVTRWGVDTLWIYHLQDGRDEKAQKVVRATISTTERARLVRSINMRLEVVQDGDRRGIKVVWARRGIKVAWPQRDRSNPILWDDTGTWAGMPERIEREVYADLSETDQDAIEEAAPTVFAGPALAIAWGLEQGCFEALPHARNAYDKLKKEHNPGSARAMRDLWVEDVQRRLEEKEAA